MTVTVLAYELSVNQAPVALTIAFITFVCGTWVGATYRTVRPRRPVGRTWVQHRSDITR